MALKRGIPLVRGHTTLKSDHHGDGAAANSNARPAIERSAPGVVHNTHREPVKRDAK